jgi:hypothetical protein
LKIGELRPRNLSIQGRFKGGAEAARFDAERLLNMTENQVGLLAKIVGNQEALNFDVSHVGRIRDEIHQIIMRTLSGFC